MISFEYRVGRRFGFFFPVVTALVLGILLSSGQSAAAEDEVECRSIRLQMATDGYDTTCSVDNVSDITYETLEANSTDGSHFLVITDARTNYGYIFKNRGLRESLTKIFSELAVSNWGGGKAEQGLMTSEFDSEFKTVASACVGFHKYTSRDQWGGWRRHIIGFGCTRGSDRAKVYDALKLVDFP